MFRRALAGVLALAVVCTGCSASDDDDAHRRSDPPSGSGGAPSSIESGTPLAPSPFRMFADGAEASWGNEHFRSPNDLVISSDLVFVGTVTGARWLGQDSREGHFPARLHALAYDVHVGKLIS